MKIYLNKSRLLAEKYQGLLASRWTLETLKESLALADVLLNDCNLPLGFSGLVRDCDPSGLPDFFISSHFNDYLKDQSALLGGRRLPDVPDKIPKRRSPSKIEYSRQTLEVIYDLSFPVFAADKNRQDFVLEGDIGFLRDLQSLIFILTADFILPLLREHRLKAEFDYLSLIMFTHSLIAWHDNPAHQNQLFSILFDRIGFKEAAVECLYVAFRLTAPEDHDYMTKAQAYWSALIEAERFDNAREFALKLLRNSPEKYLDEIKEIIELSFEMEHS